jgi:hypothetical protein
MNNRKCEKCNGKGLSLFQKPAPSPPYLEGSMLEYAVFCECIPPVETKETGTY